MPTISIIVPVYRVEKYIRRCVDSILVQSFRDYELILVDDGTPDSSGAICDEYAARDQRIRVIHKENGGLSSARNAGIDAASGEYLFFMDSDDIIHPDTLRILYECIGKTGAEISVGEFTRFTEQGSIAFSHWDGEYTVLTNLEALSTLIGGWEVASFLVSACCKLIRRNLFDGIHFPVGRFFEDEFTTYKLYHQADKIVVCRTALYYYFDNFNGITRNLSLQKRFDEYDAQWERIEFFRKNGLDALLGKAAMTFLKTAQWDLIVCRKNCKTINPEKKARFEDQYAAAFQIAKKQHVLEFIRDYDYYILAKPNMTLLWRIRRQIQLLFQKSRFSISI